MKEGANALVMREMNVRLVRDALRRSIHATRKQLAEQTGLTTVTIATCLQLLVARGEASPGDSIDSEGGRPSLQYRFHADYRHILCLYAHEDDTGRDSLHLCVSDRLGNVLKTHAMPLSSVDIHTFEPIIAKELKRDPRIGAIGFGLPGIERNGNIVVMDYPGLVGTAFTQYYETVFQRPVLLLNDANAAVLGHSFRDSSLSSGTHESRPGTPANQTTMHASQQDGLATQAGAPANDSSAYVYFPTKYPPGAGLCIDGRLLTGASGFAGEVSAIPLGIDWTDPSLYQHEARFIPAISSLCAAMIALWNPARIVLHGQFLTPAHLSQIEQETGSRIPSFAMPPLRLSDDFLTDYQAGLVRETLRLLEASLLEQE